MGDNNSIYMTLAFAGVAMMAAMVVGIVVIRRRNGRHPHHQVWFELQFLFPSLLPFVSSAQLNKHFPYTPPIITPRNILH